MDQLGRKVAGRIILDAGKGIFQNNKKKLKYKSETYKQAKKAGKASGKVSADRTTNFVNMRLTGDTLNKLSSSPSKKGFNIDYGNPLVILGNAKRDYDLYGISFKNLSFISKSLQREINRKISQYEKEDIEINLKR
ncbi:MAG: hypothetical protein GOVbin4580_45 [Prokaryotic dsDNA virus sp.]|nr:MAG: hypothetical protein GOVbin4580_45 [Prokaryotic dsDNA virus sp.]